MQPLRPLHPSPRHAVMAVLITLRHRSNIQRLLAGTESRFTKKK